MGFEWDDIKEAANVGKHGIRFDEAATVFDDPNVYVEDATRAEFGERRWKAIGSVGPALVAVIFTVRGDRRRIISARRAKRDERRSYDQGATAP